MTPASRQNNVSLVLAPPPTSVTVIWHLCRDKGALVGAEGFSSICQRVREASHAPTRQMIGVRTPGVHAAVAVNQLKPLWDVVREPLENTRPVTHR